MKLGDDIDLSEQNDVQLDPELKQNRYPDLTGAKSIMSKYLTREVFERLKEKKTPNSKDSPLPEQLILESETMKSP